jgi:hypothetical protein
MRARPRDRAFPSSNLLLQINIYVANFKSTDPADVRRADSPHRQARRPQVLVECTLVIVDTRNDFTLGLEILASGHQIVSAVNRGNQQQAGIARTMIESVDRRQVLSDLAEISGREDLLDIASRAPVIRLVNLLVFEAVQGG